jgi:hypothetical protein
VRLWSLHPSYLDRQGLTACWRESLLAQAVLAGRTRGYRHHPQLDRFRATPDPLAAVAAYLHGVAHEADRRGYRFDRSRVLAPAATGPGLEVPDGQLRHEWGQLRPRLEARSPQWLARLETLGESAGRPGAAEPPLPLPHPLFTVVTGPVAPWEVSARGGAGARRQRR